MLKERPETFASWQCSIKYGPEAWNCGAPNIISYRAVLKDSQQKDCKRMSFCLIEIVQKSHLVFCNKTGTIMK